MRKLICVLVGAGTAAVGACGERGPHIERNLEYAITIDKLERDNKGYVTAIAADPGTWASLGAHARKLDCPRGVQYVLRRITLDPEGAPPQAVVFEDWGWRLNATLAGGETTRAA